MDRLLEDYTDAQVAERLNAQNHLSGTGAALHARMVTRLRRDYGLQSRYERLRKWGLLTRDELAERLGIHPATVQHWRRQGRLVTHRYSDKPEFLYEDPGANAPLKYQTQRHRQKSDPAPATPSASPTSAVFGTSTHLCSSA